MKTLSGFQVVLRDNPYRLRAVRNPNYRGICRIPIWPSDYPSEDALLEKYVFEIRDDSGFIPDFKSAEQLRIDLEKVGCRKFEVIFCSEIPNSVPNAKPGWIMLGFDVASRDPSFRSIVLDFPALPEAVPFQAAMNRDGLFDDEIQAGSYLKFCQETNVENAGSVPFAVFKIEANS